MSNADDPLVESRLASLVAGLAHEIKNPLSTMSISLDLLAEDLEVRASIPTAQVKPRIDLIRSEIERLQGIVGDFLRLARTPQLEAEDRDLNAIIEDIEAFIAPELKEHAISVVTQLDRSVSRLRVDPGLIRQALLNLIRNAIEAMEPGGTLTIQTHARADRFAIDIIDTGSGIDPEILPRIFDGFFSAKKQGTGIGLSLTRQFIDLHGGEITVDSEPGHGSRFTIELPLEPGEGETGD